MDRHSTDFVFENAGEPWHVLVVLAIAATLAWFAWRRYGPTAGGTAGFIARLCRVAALVMLVIIIAGPAWRTTTTTVLPGRVLVAVDRSASMARNDGPAGTPRLMAAGALEHELTPLTTSRNLAVTYRGIGGVPGTIAAKTLSDGTLTATGTASALADELERLVAEQRPDQLIVVSDGRVTSGSGLAALPAAWRGRDLKLAVLSAGSEMVEGELVIDEVVINREVALGEREPVLVRLSTRALAAGPITVTVLVDGEAPVTSEVAAPGGDAAAMQGIEAQLEANFRREGATRLRVVADYGTGANKRHAEQEIAVTVSERKLRVLLLEHRPRYEVRYLREAFKRDKTITLHAYLAEGRWRRWGTGSAAEAGPDHLPLAPNELRDYDVILIGDLGPDTLKDADQASLDAAVRRGGAGLVWLPGETGAIAGFASGKLGALIPVELPDATAISRGYLAGDPHQASRTPAAAGLGLLDAGEVEWNQLPPLLGAAPVGSIKPLAEVLVEDQRKQPLVVTRSYGAGRVLFIGADDTWRWRRNVGDRYLHRFHSQLLRFAAAGRRLGTREWRLFANPRRAVSGELVTLSLAPIGAVDEHAPDGATVRLKGPGGVEQLLRLTADGRGFSAKLPAPTAGAWSLEVASGPDPRVVDADQLLVLPPADELRDPRLDRAALAALAAGTGGRVYTDAAKLVAELPDLSHSESVSVVTSWWDTLWALVAVVTLLAIDWSIRRLNRLP